MDDAANGTSRGGQSAARRDLPLEATGDPHRPTYHLQPRSAWLNDPNGLIHRDGAYHVFYQYAPDAPWEEKQWGHAASPDLVRWTDLPVALVPTPGGADADGCWSGSAVDDGGVPTLLYSGLRANEPWQLPCLARSRDGMRTWEKHPGNPVVAAPPPGLDLTGFRDPRVWREDGAWSMLLGAGVRGAGGAALLYRSPDLVTWEYLHPLLEGDAAAEDPVWTGAMWECPDFFPLGDRHVLLVSALDGSRANPTGFRPFLHHAAYFSGEYRERRLLPRAGGVVDHGGHFYAPQTLLDPRGRRLMWGWIWEGRSDEAALTAGWAGALSLPRVLSLTPDGALLQRPAPELEALRGAHHHVGRTAIAPGEVRLIDGVGGDRLELALELDLGDAERVGVAVRVSPDGEERTLLLYDRMAETLTVERDRSSLSPEVRRDTRGGPLALGAGEPLRLRVFVDGSVLEVFANDRLCLASRVYPSRPDSRGVGLVAEGGEAALLGLDAWAMGSIREG